MSRSTRLVINTHALLHNLQQIRQYAPGKKIIAMVKANAYGCGITNVVPVLDKEVDGFGVACRDEAFQLRKLGCQSEVILFQGVFDADEWAVASENNFTCVVHNPLQIQWLLAKPLSKPVKLWVKVNTGMNRLGFKPQEIRDIFQTLKQCPWVNPQLGLMTHLACADEIDNICNRKQLNTFNELLDIGFYETSMANSAAIMQFPEMHQDIVRPGIMLYGVSPFVDKIGSDLGLMPVLRFMSCISTVHHFPANSFIGYGCSWKTTKPSLIGIVAAGYGDGYPRHISEHTTVWVKGYEVPIVGRVSMDMLAIDLTETAGCGPGDEVELWGQFIPVENVAKSAKTLGYELLCQLSERVRYATVDNI